MDLDPTQPHDSVPKEKNDASEQIEIKPQVEDSNTANVAVDLQKQLNLEPTTIVLAKVKGYRAWPAMVLDEKILPENIQKMRPKSIKLARKQKGPVIVVPVRFFSDDTYIWIKSCDLKVLPAAEIDDFLLKRANAKKHDTLIDAYKLAQNPPDMLEFNKWGSQGPPEFTESAEEEEEEEDEDEDEDDLESEQPKKKVLKLSIKLKKSSRSKAPTKPANSKPALKPTRGQSQRQKTEEIAKKEEVLEEQEPISNDSQEGFDSDWGIDDEEHDLEGGNYIFDDEQEQKEFIEQFPRAADLSLTLEQFQTTFADIHREISPVLLEGEIDNEKKMVTKLRELERLLASSETPIIAFTKSPLFRVLLLTVHKPQERFPHPAIRNAIGRVLEQLNLHTCEITEEDMVIKTKDNTPLPSESAAGDDVLVVD